MSLDRTHRRLSVALALSALAAFSGGAGFEPVGGLLAAVLLLAILVRPPNARVARVAERILGPLAALLVLRVLVHIFVLGGDVVMPVVDLLLLLLCGECMRAPESKNEVRIYALAFALLLAATAYRPGVLFALAFVVFVALASVTVPVGLLRRKAERFGLREVKLDRAFVGTSLALSLVTLGASAVVFLAFPRVSRAGPGGADRMARSVAGFSDQISIGEHGSRIYANPEIVLRVEFPDGRPLDFLSFHWRGRSYDRFDGVRWHRTRGIRPSAAPPRWYDDRWPGPRIRQEIWAAPLDVRVLFALHPVVELDTRPGLRPLMDNVGDLSYWGSSTPAYTAVSVVGRPRPDSLRAADGGFGPDRARYLQLPELPARIHALADSLTRDQPTRYDKVVAVERYLRSFRYTRELPRTAEQTSLDYFLFERKAGHCEYFSTAMVVLLREAGITARNVNGFLGGRWNEVGAYLAVTQNEAHSWVEVWFPEYGWVTFDPTPSGDTAGTEATAWFWPGRFLLDGLQHRWSKWILDYSLTEQTSAFRTLRRWLTPDRPQELGGPGSWMNDTRIWLGLLALMVGLAALRWLRLRARRRPESVAYRKALRLARRAGIVEGGQVAPLALLRRIRTRAPAAAPAAETLVELYLEARFSGRPPPPDLRSSMGSALSGLRRALR